jgi:hypothetical protein
MFLSASWEFMAPMRDLEIVAAAHEPKAIGSETRLIAARGLRTLLPRTRAEPNLPPSPNATPCRTI